MSVSITDRCREIRRTILLGSAKSGHGHIPTSFSVVEMLCAVYETMRHDPRRPDWNERDMFLLSKGHAALALYSTLAHYGYFAPDEVGTMGAFQSRLGCHPDRHKVPGAEASTGSLGHGIALAAGMALAFRMQGSPRLVYTLIGDGEANEGSVWEAIMVATHQQLTNLTILVDFNKSQTRSLQIPNPAERLAAFGCDVQEVDGHDVAAIRAALARPVRNTRAVVCRTVKGQGATLLAENMFEWHRKSPTPEQLQQLLHELDAQTV